MLDKVREFIASELKVDPAKITLETDLNKDLKADSLDMVELLMSLEEEYQITIDDEDAMKLRTVADIVQYLEKRNLK